MSDTIGSNDLYCIAKCPLPEGLCLLFQIEL